MTKQHYRSTTSIEQQRTKTLEIINLLADRLANARDAADYLRVGEATLAVEMLADWCVDAEPPVTLTGAELRLFYDLAESLENSSVWIELLPLVDLSTDVDLPNHAQEICTLHLARELASNHQRLQWVLLIKKTAAKLWPNFAPQSPQT